MLWWIPIVSWILVKAIVTSSSPPDSFCQLAVCNHTSPVDVQLCATSFMAVDLIPMEPRKFKLSRWGRHLFDLFYGSFDADCIKASLFVYLYEETLSVKMVLLCRNTTVSMSLDFSAINVLKNRCVEQISNFKEIAKGCSYHQSEQLRITMIENNTLLVEDLSLSVPAGTRMIFSNRDSSIKQKRKKPCRCRSLRRDQRLFSRCTNLLHKLYHSKDRLQQEKERSSRDFKLGLVIILITFMLNFFGRWLVNRLFPDSEFVAKVVYVASTQRKDLNSSILETHGEVPGGSGVQLGCESRYGN